MAGPERGRNGNGTGAADGANEVAASIGKIGTKWGKLRQVALGDWPEKTLCDKVMQKWQKSKSF